MALTASKMPRPHRRKGAENRDKLKGRALQLKGEALEKLENLKKSNEAAYVEILDGAAARYKRVKRASAAELENITLDLKSAWAHIGKALKAGGKPAAPGKLEKT